MGFFAMTAMIILDYRKFEELGVFLYIGSLLFLLSVYVPGLGVVSNGARSWIDIGITTLQPSEIVKISYTILMANYFSRRQQSLTALRGVLSAAFTPRPLSSSLSRKIWEAPLSTASSGCL